MERGKCSVKAEMNSRGFVLINVHVPNSGRERGRLFGCQKRGGSEKGRITT